MNFQGTMHPTELSMLAAVVDEYCLELDVNVSDILKEAIAARAIYLFSTGLKNRIDLKHALRSQLGSGPVKSLAGLKFA